MTIKDPRFCTKLEVWKPKYSAKYTDTEEWIALVADYKLQQATPVVLIEFPKAKHLDGQRFAITREKALKMPLESNGKIPCRAVPMSEFENWQTYDEVRDIAMEVFDD